ncbi:hypothetical protein CROQUDRAFT_135186 [Cronartium quercuum f. sp. fusiforme G11]|uniref:Uncharacterized protein n=1 Tax=Cronartium quercuum f. sp. fusiforme G11 TaxID=708437 RepID=A0A9P6NAN4_9BASI|nr:hypothetical protein CROQUDRAFT_135186 [Cronartium quercuum f. sp. fusiforme G11]
MRAFRILRQEASNAQATIHRQRQTSADPSKYHTQPSGFWEKFRQRLVVNPEFSSGMPLNEVVRSPPPASATTVQVTPASKASDPAENAYFERDFRRMYPKLEMITQPELSKLLIHAPDQLKLPTPSYTPSESGDALTTIEAGPSLSSVLLSSSGATAFRPPTPPGTPC